MSAKKDKTLKLHNQKKILLGVVSIALVGSILLLITTQAATPFVSLEPESGTVNSPAEEFLDNSASGNEAIKFGDKVVDPPAGGKPNASNTGWQHTGVTLTNAGTMTVTQNGAVIDSVNVDGCIYVQANNVTIKRSKINSTCFSAIDIRDWQGVSGLVIEDVEVNGGSNTDNCIAFGSYTARRVNLYNCYDGAKFGDNTTIEDSYIHDLLNKNGCHCDGVQTTGGRNINMRRNNIDVAGSGAAVMFGDEDGVLENIVFAENWVNGGNFGFYGGHNQSTNYQPKNMSVTNNKFGRDFNYGPAVYVAPTTTWSGNVYEDNNQTISRP